MSAYQMRFGIQLDIYDGITRIFDWHTGKFWAVDPNTAFFLSSIIEGDIESAINKISIESW